MSVVLFFLFFKYIGVVVQAKEEEWEGYFSRRYMCAQVQTSYSASLLSLYLLLREPRPRSLSILYKWDHWKKAMKWYIELQASFVFHPLPSHMTLGKAIPFFKLFSFLFVKWNWQFLLSLQDCCKDRMGEELWKSIWTLWSFPPHMCWLLCPVPTGPWAGSWMGSSWIGLAVREPWAQCEHKQGATLALVLGLIVTSANLGGNCPGGFECKYSICGFKTHPPPFAVSINVSVFQVLHPWNVYCLIYSIDFS